MEQTDPPAGLWPQIGADEHDCATMEWWIGTRKLTLYTVGHPRESLLKSWGPNVHSDMEFVSLMDSCAVRKAFEWLSAEAAPYVSKWSA